MTEIDLYDWFCLLRRDLNRLFETTPEWNSYDEFSILNRHLERIFWILAIVPEDLGDEQIYIKVRNP